MNKGQLVQHREWGMKSEEGGGGGGGAEILCVCSGALKCR